MSHTVAHPTDIETAAHRANRSRSAAMRLIGIGRLGVMTLDDGILEECGLGRLNTADRAGLLRAAREALEMRVGARLSTKLSDALFEDFLHIDAVDRAAGRAWLDAHVPGHSLIVAEELGSIRAELRGSAQHILATVGI